ncbi:hypothetical protein OXX69_001437 [Metschnikowia pulcherrima]
MTRSTAPPTTTSATPTETFSDLMSKFSIISPSSDLTWKQKETPAEYSFDATSFVSQQVMGPVKRDSELTDYKLERDKTQLFPDFYYQFVKNFSKESCVNAAYCDRDVAAFKATFEGSENDIRRVVAHVKNDFATAFRQSLGESFDEEYETTFFDRYYVENQFVKKMIELKEWPAIGIRQNAVIGKALSGDVKPYVWFLKAYNSTDEEIWAQVYPLLIKGCSTRQDVKTFQKNMEKLQAKDGNIIDNMKEFVECLESKDLFSKRQQRGRPQLKAPKDRDFPVQDRKSVSPTKQGGGPPKLQKKWNGEKGPPSGANPGVHQGKPEGNTTATDKPAASSYVLTELGSDEDEYTTTNCIDCKFLWDTGTTTHVVNDPSLFWTSYPMNKPIKSLVAYEECTAIGEIRCRLQDGTVLALQNTLLVKGSDRNLMSPNVFQDFHCYTQQGKVIKSDTSKEIGYIEGGLPVVPVTILKPGPECYVVDTHDDVEELKDAFDINDENISLLDSGDETPFNADVVSDIDDSEKQILGPQPVSASVEWHFRFGHPGAAHFAQLKKRYGPDDIVHIASKDCEGCMTSKIVQSMPKISEQLTKVHRPFEIIHVDLSGPFNYPRSYDNAAYFLAIIDRFAHTVHVSLLKEKSEAGSQLIKFLTEAHTTLAASHYPRQIRSDNGNEFVNSQVNGFLSQHGIQGKYTQGYSSYQNGIAERMNRSLQEKVRVFLAQGHVPLEFWTEAIRLAAFVLNCTPRGSNSQSPFELFYPEGKVPMNRKFHTFGCLAYVRYPKSLKTSKFRPNAVPCAYFGPAESRAGHRFFNFDPPQVFESDEATFHETRFYFKEYSVSPEVLQTFFGKKSPASLLPPIKYPPAAKRRTKEQRQEDMKCLQQLFALDNDVSRGDDSSFESSSSVQDPVPPPDVAKINPTSRGTPATKGGFLYAHLLSNEKSLAVTPSQAHTSPSSLELSKEVPEKSKPIVDSLPVSATSEKELSQTPSLNAKEAQFGVSIAESLSPRSQLISSKSSSVSLRKGEAFSTAQDGTAATSIETIHRSVTDSGVSSKKRSRDTEPTPAFQRITRLKTGAIPRRRFLVSRGRHDTFGNTISNSRAVRISEVADCANYADVMQWHESCNVEDVDIEDQEIPLDSDANVRRNAARTYALFQAAVYHVISSADLNQIVPESLAQARKLSDWPLWKEACVKEMDAHSENGTFDAVPRPDGVRLVGCRWVFTIKDCGLKKARLVAKGYTQVEGIDFHETFAPVIKHTTLRLILAIAAASDKLVNQFDVASAFLHSELKEDIYMKQPPGFHIDPVNEVEGQEYVLKLNKSLYGLKQAPLVWNETINAELLKQGFKRTINEPCLYYKGQGDDLVLIALYVDDLLVVANNQADIEKVKKDLNLRFKMKDLGEAKKFLGINIEHGDNYTKIHLTDYIDSLLKDYHMETCNQIQTPAVTYKDSIGSGDDNDAYHDPTEYRSIVGKLLYAANTVRLDISYIVSRLSRYLASPRVKDMIDAKRVLRYLKGTKSLGLVYIHGTNIDLTCYCDADFASDIETNSRSITGSIIMFGNSPVCWKSKLQTMVALSTVNAELVALCHMTSETLWMSNLLKELGLDSKCKVLCDNQGAIKTVKNGSVLDGTKHIRVKAHFIKEQLDQGLFNLDYVNTSDNVADIFTKALPYPSFSQLRMKANLRDSP